MIDLRENLTNHRIEWYKKYKEREPKNKWWKSKTEMKQESRNENKIPRKI